MKCLILLCVFGIISLAFAGTSGNTRGCRWVMGKCVEQCPEGTHSYSPSGTGGCGKKMPEATCAEPLPVPEDADICDFSACYCDAPTVRDPISGKCVNRDQCPVPL